MKIPSLALILGLLSATVGFARNPEPLRFRGKETTALPSPVRRVVLVHGFLENGNSFRTLKKQLERRGVACLVPKLRPSDGRGGLHVLAEQLKEEIEATYGTTEPISIIAFSMGGIVSRQYLQNLGGASRCERLFTISSPHHGTKAAWLYPTKGAGEMRPDSPFLANLKATESQLGDMPVVSYLTPLDLVILPADSSVWERAENIRYPALLHPLMLTSGPVLDDIERRLLE